VRSARLKISQGGSTAGTRSHTFSRARVAGEHHVDTEDVLFPTLLPRLSLPSGVEVRQEVKMGRITHSEALIVDVVFLHLYIECFVCTRYIS